MSSTETPAVLEKWVDDLRIGIMPVTRSMPLTGRRLSDNRTVSFGEIGTHLDKYRQMAMALKEMSEAQQPPSAPPDEKQWKEERAKLEKELQELRDKLAASVAIDDAVESLKSQIASKVNQIEELTGSVNYHQGACETLGNEVKLLRDGLADAEARASRALDDKVRLESQLENAFASFREAMEENAMLKLEIESLKNARQDVSYISVSDERVVKVEGEMVAMKQSLNAIGQLLVNLSN